MAVIEKSNSTPGLPVDSDTSTVSKLRTQLVARAFGGLQSEDEKLDFANLLSFCDESAAVLSSSIRDSISRLRSAIKLKSYSDAEDEVRFLNKIPESSSQVLVNSLRSSRQMLEISWFTVALSEMPQSSVPILIQALKSTSDAVLAGRYLHALAIIEKPIAADSCKDLQESLVHAFDFYTQDEVREAAIDATPLIGSSLRAQLLSNWLEKENLSSDLREYLQDAINE